MNTDQEILKKEELRVIKTARKKKAINKAAKNGLWPLIKKVIPSPEIQTKYCVVQNNATGEIEVHEDFRTVFHKDIEPENSIVIDWTFYYPYDFPAPYAAYLVPKDIQVGEKVILEDLIEDYVGSSWNQGDTLRLHSCEAIWNGKDFEILYDSRSPKLTFVG